MQTKCCSICKQELSIDLFSTRNDRKVLTYQSSCKKCHSEYRKNHYKENKEKYIKKAKEYNKKVLDWFEDIKKTLFCKNCGENRWWLLDFHHLDPSEKEHSIAKLKHQGSKPKLLKEMKKCDVLCSNCHRDLHYHEKMQEKC